MPQQPPARFTSPLPAWRLLLLLPLLLLLLLLGSSMTFAQSYLEAELM
jgi:hypothetical protein